MPRVSDAIEQLFWVDDDDAPVAAAVLTEWRDGWGLDPIALPGIDRSAICERALEAIVALGLERVDTLVRDDDAEMLRFVAGAGFVAQEERDGTTWMNAGDHLAPTAVAEGFALVDRAKEHTRPHPMRHRNGDAVEERLQQCSLYDPELDLAVRTADGEYAGYALFWFDPVTKVGLLEPMRVEDAFQRRGLARALLTEGLERLVGMGARRLKVSYATDAARARYTGAGFRVTATSTTYTLRQ
jgi:predicted N-acetyltransferase YhbS